jgi:hypothetical protein
MLCLRLLGLLLPVLATCCCCCSCVSFACSDADTAALLPAQAPALVVVDVAASHAFTAADASDAALGSTVVSLVLLPLSLLGVVSVGFNHCRRILGTAAAAAAVLPASVASRAVAAACFSCC